MACTRAPPHCPALPLHTPSHGHGRAAQFHWDLGGWGSLTRRGGHAALEGQVCSGSWRGDVYHLTVHPEAKGIVLLLNLNMHTILYMADYFTVHPVCYMYDSVFVIAYGAL